MIALCDPTQYTHDPQFFLSSGAQKPCPEKPGRIDALLSGLASLGITPSLENLIFLIVGLMVFKSAISFGALSYAGISAARVANALRRRLIGSIFDKQR